MLKGIANPARSTRTFTVDGTYNKSSSAHYVGVLLVGSGGGGGAGSTLGGAGGAGAPGICIVWEW